jgi:hypothetical protein
VALDTERALLVAGGAFAPAGADFHGVFILEPDRMHALQKVIALVAFLAVVAHVADHARLAVIQAGVIPVLADPERRYVVCRNFAPGSLVAEDTVFLCLHPVVAAHAGLHAGQVPGGGGIRLCHLTVTVRAGDLFFNVYRVVEFRAVPGDPGE